MLFDRKILFNKFPWLKEKNLPMIISADYDGLICASFLHHYLNWEIVGYYDLETIWISEKGIIEKPNLVWVDLNILPKQGKAIGGHIISLSNEIPIGFETSCNPNILAQVNAQNFVNKFPFSTLIYLLWLHNIDIKNNLHARQLILHSDASWLKIQNYPENCTKWTNIMTHYNWDLLFDKINSKKFEKQIDENLYPMLQLMNAISGKSKLKSKYLNIKSKQYQFNPDWDEDIILKLLNLFAINLEWTPPEIPKIIQSITGDRKKVPLALIKQTGLINFLNNNRVFSYAIPSPRVFNFTSFGMKYKSPIDKKNE
jgi:hypothetical protein